MGKNQNIHESRFSDPRLFNLLEFTPMFEIKGETVFTRSNLKNDKYVLFRFLGLTFCEKPVPPQKVNPINAELNHNSENL